MLRPIGPIHPFNPTYLVILLICISCQTHTHELHFAMPQVTVHILPVFGRELNRFVFFPEAVFSLRGRSLPLSAALEIASRNAFPEKSVFTAVRQNIVLLSSCQVSPIAASKGSPSPEFLLDFLFRVWVWVSWSIFFIQSVVGGGAGERSVRAIQQQVTAHFANTTEVKENDS